MISVFRTENAAETMENVKFLKNGDLKIINGEVSYWDGREERWVLVHSDCKPETDETPAPQVYLNLILPKISRADADRIAMFAMGFVSTTDAALSVDYSDPI